MRCQNLKLVAAKVVTNVENSDSKLAADVILDEFCMDEENDNEDFGKINLSWMLIIQVLMNSIIDTI